VRTPPSVYRRVCWRSDRIVSLKYLRPFTRVSSILVDVQPPKVQSQERGFLPCRQALLLPRAGAVWCTRSARALAPPLFSFLLLRGVWRPRDCRRIPSGMKFRFLRYDHSVRNRFYSPSPALSVPVLFLRSDTPPPNGPAVCLVGGFPQLRYARFILFFI